MISLYIYLSLYSSSYAEDLNKELISTIHVENNLECMQV
jgi:hypothetical protein